MQRQTAFTQQEVAEMQKGYRTVLENFEERVRKIRNRYIGGFNITDTLKGLQEEVKKEIDVINKDIEIEADHDQII